MVRSPTAQTTLAWIDPLLAAGKFRNADEKKLAAVRAGTMDRSWVDASLREKGVEIIDDVYRF